MMGLTLRGDLTKARRGEGARGGQVIGHTRSGKPVYFSKGGNSFKDSRTSTFTADDHDDAARLHRGLAASSPARPAGSSHLPEKYDHEMHASTHESMAQDKRRFSNGQPFAEDEPVTVQPAVRAPGFKIPAPPADVAKACRLVLHARAVTSGLVLKAGRPPALKPDASPGATLLGKTKSKKPVFASGAETAKYSPDDHADAAALHHEAHQHHEERAGDHTEGAKTDEDWRRQESRQADAGRHRKLADHHHELARDHLLAAGRSSSVEVAVHGDGVTASKPKPGDPKEKAEAVARLKARTHANHPGGITPRDTAAYADQQKQAASR